MNVYFPNVDSSPIGLKSIYNTCEKCVKKLMFDGYTSNEAEGFVLEVLNECETEIKHGKYIEVSMILSNIFRV